MIGVYIRLPITVEQYQDLDAKIRGAGIVAKGLKVHTCFGEGGQIAIFDVWETQEDYEQFIAQLGPIMGDTGMEPLAPDIVPMIDFRTE